MWNLALYYQCIRNKWCEHESRVNYFYCKISVLQLYMTMTNTYTRFHSQQINSRPTLYLWCAISISMLAASSLPCSSYCNSQQPHSTFCTLVHPGFTKVYDTPKYSKYVISIMPLSTSRCSDCQRKGRPHRENDLKFSEISHFLKERDHR